MNGLLSSPFFPLKMKAIIVNRNYNSHYAKMLVHIYFLMALSQQMVDFDEK